MTTSELKTPTERLWNEAPVCLDVITSGGQLLCVNHTQTQLLGYSPGELDGSSWERIYTKSSREFLSGLFEESGTTTIVRSLQLRHSDRQLIELSSHAQIIEDDYYGKCLSIAKTLPTPVQQQADMLEQDLDILKGIIQRSRDPSWCIEYPEPVDLAAPEDEIIRQIFDNRRHWRHCNEAMAKMYRLPSGNDLNNRSVDEIFHRNPANEEFVRTLIQHDFNVDGVPSYDQRYDGTEFYVENDVRSKIENGFLLRMWGTLRDLSKQHRREKELVSRRNEVEAILNGIIDPLMVISETGVIMGINPAVEQSFGWPSERILGECVDHLFHSKESVDNMLMELRANRSVYRLPIEVKCRDGSVLTTETSAGINRENDVTNFVLVLRLASSSAHINKRTA